jgi:ppGpp synthetase/RelA/SpoT-type nucleotidyltranferase
MAAEVKSKFLSLLRKSSQFKSVKILVDIKGLESFVDKAINRYPLQGKGASDITDVLRSAILVSNQDEVEKTVKNIKKYFTVAKHKEKIEGNDPTYGYYGSHHFYVKIGKLFSEIQVMTKKLWSYKDEAHKIYNKYRSIKDADDRVKKLDIELSKQLFKTANKDKKVGRKKGKPQLKKHKKWKFNRSKLDF